MSRYSKDMGKFVFSWGFDTPLMEYFFQCFNKQADPDEDDCVFSISSHNTLVPHPDKPSKYSYSNSEILEVIEKEEKDQLEEILPKAHKEAIAFDLPF